MQQKLSLTALLIIVFFMGYAQQWQVVGQKAFGSSGHKHHLAFSPASSTPYLFYDEDAYGGGVVQKYNGDRWVFVGDTLFAPEWGSVQCSGLACHPSSGNPYVTYAKGRYQVKTTVKRWNGDQWQFIGKDSLLSKGISYHRDITITSKSAHIYIAHTDKGYGNGQLIVQRYSEETWSMVSENPVSSGSVGYLDMAAAPGTDIPYVAYVDYSDGVGITVQKWQQETWSVLGQSSLDDTTGTVSLAISPSSGTPYIAYPDGDHDNSITVQKFEDHKWQKVGKTGFSNKAGGVELSFKPGTDTPYIAYYDKSHDWQAMVQRFDGKQWTTVGSSHFSEGRVKNISLAFHPDSQVPYIAFRDIKNNGKTTVMAFQ